MARWAADRVLHRLRTRSLSVLGVATGSSPLPVYRALAASGEPALASLRVFALDEYVGLPHHHPQSYHCVVDREVTRPLGLDPARVHVPDGAADDLDAAAAEYEHLIAASGGIDLQVLGIGANGHVGFNEPFSSLRSRTRVETLTARTRRDNARFFGGDLQQVPTSCLTQGLGTILDADEVVLIATGAAKAHAVAQMVEGPLSSACPASVLQLHPRATVLLDDRAAAQLTRRDDHEQAGAATGPPRNP
nr:glucosamine-6-phosphate deaminase [Kineococcus aurantiacus]